MASAAQESAEIRHGVWSGLLVACLLAIGAKLLADLAGTALFHAAKTPVSPVLCAVLFGVLWRNTLGVAEHFGPGLATTSTTVLRIGIALVGLKLTLATVGQVGLYALPIVIGCMATALGLSCALASPLRLTRNLSQLLAVGAAVCGCTAVLAVAPIIRARKDEMGYAVACVVLFGVLAMLAYPWLAHSLLGAHPSAAGIFLGTAIHDTSQVIGAGLIYSQQFDSPDALAAATTAKLLRNISMVLLIPWFAWAAARDSQQTQPAVNLPSAASLVPAFVWGFVALVVLRTLGDMFVAPTSLGVSWAAATGYASTASEFLLTAGMAAVGLGISLDGFRGIGWRPLAAAMIIALGVGVVSLLMTYWVSGLM